MNKNVVYAVHKKGNGANKLMSFTNRTPRYTSNFCKPRMKNTKRNEIEVVAIDCEMVGIGYYGQKHMLARVSIVNSKGKTIYDKFVQPTEEVTDYRTPVSGIRLEDIKHGEIFAIVKKEVTKILENKLLVGHALANDLRVLKITHPQYLIRDTSTYWEYKRFTGGRIPGLKRLTMHYLGASIQDGEHSSVQDAKAALQLYMIVRKEWETMVRKRFCRRKNGNKLQNGLRPKHKL